MDDTGTLRTRNSVDEQRLADFERRMELPILLSALLPIVFALAGRESIISSTIQVVAWVVFIIDLVVHVRLIPRYLRTGLGVFDIVVVGLTAPWFLIPGLGDARFLALARLARLVRIAKAGGRELRRLGAQLGRVGLVVASLVFTCAYVAYSEEKSVNDSFATFGDSLWWAVVTITTVGYGDIVPITTVGRVTAVILMFSGLGVLGILAGVLASFFGFSDSAASADAGIQSGAMESEPAESDSLQNRLADLRARVAELDHALVAVQDELP